MLDFWGVTLLLRIGTMQTGISDVVAFIWPELEWSLRMFFALSSVASWRFQGSWHSVLHGNKPRISEAQGQLPFSWGVAEAQTNIHEHVGTQWTERTAILQTTLPNKYSSQSTRSNPHLSHFSGFSQLWHFWLTGQKGQRRQGRLRTLSWILEGVWLRCLDGNW